VDSASVTAANRDEHHHFAFQRGAGDAQPIAASQAEPDGIRVWEQLAQSYG